MMFFSDYTSCLIGVTLTLLIRQLNIKNTYLLIVFSWQKTGFKYTLRHI